jgi:predicted ATPase
VSGAPFPAGTVTFLFTDVEGSTRLLAEHGDGYPELLAEHRRLLRGAFAAHGGVEVDTQGDAFFIAFARASDAVAAAHAGQEALAATPVRVRMGLHTGEPRLTGEGYVGMDVHRGARIAAAGHGGQVLVSEQTARLLDGTPLRDLGVHRLKDVGETRVFQLGDGDFPPLKTLFHTNLPTSPNPLVGRKKELIDVVRLLTVEHTRVVTLTGPGGTGKTRFAVAAAAEVSDAFADGTWFVDLSAVREYALVLPTIATTLGAQASLREHIGRRELLLVLDNLEQVVEAARDLGELVSACSGLQLLTTSREPLHISQEREYPLKPLPESPAVELFRQRAHVDVDYDIAAQICDRVDRLPLAIELAAARVKVLEPGALLDRLEQRLPLLASRSRDAPERQRTLHSTIAWSYELLAAKERTLFGRLAVFAGGCTLEAAEAVCEADIDTLESLVEKSLLRRRDERFVMLETIREYALERLAASGQADAVRRRHAEFFLELALSAGLYIEAEIEQRHDLVLADQDNLRAAVDWAAAVGETQFALELMVAMENFWVSTSPAEAARRFERLLPPVRPADGIYARALRVWGTVEAPQDPERGRQLLEEAQAIFEHLGDDLGRALILPRLTSWALEDGHLDRAEAMTREALAVFRARNFTKAAVPQIGLLGEIACRRGDYATGLALLVESADAAAGIGFRWWRGVALATAAEYGVQAGRTEDAERWGTDALSLLAAIRHRTATVITLACLAQIAAERGERERAGTLWGAVEAEEARAAVPGWETERQRFEGAVLADADADFARGRASGRALALEDAVRVAVADA